MRRIARALPHLCGIAILLPLGLIGVSAALEDASDAPEGESDGGEGSVPDPANTEMAVILMRAGLDARDLSAAGVTAEDVPDLVDAGELIIDEATLQATDQTYSDARMAHDVLARKVRSGLASPEEVLQLQTLKAELETATTAREGLLQSYFDAAAATLTTPVRTTLETIRANSEMWRFPEEHLVLDREERAWVDLREDLATERIAAKYDEEFPPEVQADLAAERATPEVAAAISSIALNYAAVQTAWNAAVSD